MIYCEACQVIPVAVDPSYCDRCLEEIINDLAKDWSEADYLTQIKITDENITYGRLGV